MGLFNRPYWRDSGGAADGPGWMGTNLRFYLPRPKRMVVAILVACVAAFFLPLFFGEGPVLAWGGLYAGKWYQAWRLVTFQFLHGGGWHLFLNLMGLYFFAPPLEEAWGGRRFLRFYLACGCLAGVAFVLLGLAGSARNVPLVGSSGGVLACVAACAVLMPQMNILMIPIRWATVGLLAIYGLNVVAELAAGHSGAIGDAAHLGGMLAGGAWAMARRGPERPSALSSLRTKLRRGAWRRRQDEEARRRLVVDRILDKVHREGIGSLSGREKKTLQEETDRQREGRGRM